MLSLHVTEMMTYVIVMRLLQSIILHLQYCTMDEKDNFPSKRRKDTIPLFQKVDPVFFVWNQRMKNSWHILFIAVCLRTLDSHHTVDSRVNLQLFLVLVGFAYCCSQQTVHITMSVFQRPTQQKLGNSSIPTSTTGWLASKGAFKSRSRVTARTTACPFLASKVQLQY